MSFVSLQLTQTSSVFCQSAAHANQQCLLSVCSSRKPAVSFVSLQLTQTSSVFCQSAAHANQQCLLSVCSSGKPAVSFNSRQLTQDRSLLSAYYVHKTALIIVCQPAISHNSSFLRLQLAQNNNLFCQVPADAKPAVAFIRPQCSQNSRLLCCCCFCLVAGRRKQQSLLSGCRSQKTAVSFVTLYAALRKQLSFLSHCILLKKKKKGKKKKKKKAKKKRKEKKSDLLCEVEAT